MSPKIHLIEYTDAKFQEQEIGSPSEINEFLGDNSVTWVNVNGLGDVDILQQLGEVLPWSYG